MTKEEFLTKCDSLYDQATTRGGEVAACGLVYIQTNAQSYSCAVGPLRLSDIYTAYDMGMDMVDNENHDPETII